MKYCFRLTVSYRHPGAEPGKYTTKDMAAGDTVFGEHKVLIKQAYIDALRAIRTEGTDEYLVSYFFKTAINRMNDEISQKKKQSRPVTFIF